MIGRLGDDIGICHSGRIEADLICTCQQKVAHILGAAHSATNGQGHETLLGCSPGEIIQRAAVFMGGFDIKKAQFVGPGSTIGSRRFHGVACVHQVNKIHSFHHAPVSHVQARYDPCF